MVGVLVNVVAIILGGTVGLIAHKGLNEKVKTVIMQGIGLSVIIIGVSGAIVTKTKGIATHIIHIRGTII